MLDLADKPQFQEAIEDQSMKSVESPRRGRKKLPILWSRIIDIEDPKLRLADGFDI